MGNRFDPGRRSTDEHRLHVQPGRVRGARLAGRSGRPTSVRPRGRGTCVDHQPAAEAGPRGGADGQRSEVVRDADPRAGPDDRHGRSDLQKGVHARRREGVHREHGRGDKSQQTVHGVRA